jgi:hypothetical protein
MKETITKCGYRCDICPAYAPNIGSDEDARKACEGFHAYYGFTLTPAEIACAGCLNEGRHIDADCPVRPCVIKKGLDNCAQCSSFDACEKLSSRMDFLESIPEKLAHIPPEDFKKFVEPFRARPRMLALRSEYLREKGS